MKSLSKEFKEKYKVPGTKKVIGGIMLATALGASALSGCGREVATDQEQVIKIINQEPTKEKGENYTDEEKEKIKKIIDQKDEFLNKVIEIHMQCHPNKKISKNDIIVVEEKNLGEWIYNGRHYIDQDSNQYKNIEKVERDKQACDFLIINKATNKVLFAISRDNGEIHESFIEGYYSVEEKRGFMNDRLYTTVVNNEYSNKKCFKGAKALYEYRTNSIYNDWEQYFKTHINTKKAYTTNEEPEL